jgi:hypothetical protein
MSHRAGYIDVLEEQYEIACLIIRYRNPHQP